MKTVLIILLTLALGAPLSAQGKFKPLFRGAKALAGALADLFVRESQEAAKAAKHEVDRQAEALQKLLENVVASPVSAITGSDGAFNVLRRHAPDQVVAAFSRAARDEPAFWDALAKDLSDVPGSVTSRAIAVARASLGFPTRDITPDQMAYWRHRFGHDPTLALESFVEHMALLNVYCAQLQSEVARTNLRPEVLAALFKRIALHDSAAEHWTPKTLRVIDRIKAMRDGSAFAKDVNAEFAVDAAKHRDSLPAKPAKRPLASEGPAPEPQAPENTLASVMRQEGVKKWCSEWLASLSVEDRSFLELRFSHPTRGRAVPRPDLAKTLGVSIDAVRSRDQKLLANLKWFLSHSSRFGADMKVNDPSIKATDILAAAYYSAGCLATGLAFIWSEFELDLRWGYAPVPRDGNV